MLKRLIVLAGLAAFVLVGCSRLESKDMKNPNRDDTAKTTKQAGGGSAD